MDSPLPLSIKILTYHGILSSPIDVTLIFKFYYFLVISLWGFSKAISTKSCCIKDTEFKKLWLMFKLDWLIRQECKDSYLSLALILRFTSESTFQIPPSSLEIVFKVSSSESKMLMFSNAHSFSMSCFFFTLSAFSIFFFNQ